MKSLLSPLLVALLALPARAADPPTWSDGFEAGLGGWQAVPEKQPLLVDARHVRSGQAAAYSGPPASLRGLRRAFEEPLTGRVEIWFYDDLAPAKQQIISVGNADSSEILGLVCRTGATWQSRVGTTYTDTGVKRTAGWQQVAFECDGAITVAQLNGREVARNGWLDRLHSLLIGSMWDNSTGWYDDLAIWRRPPTATGTPGGRVRAALDAARPQLATAFRAAALQPLGPETPLARECYRRLLRYVRLTAPRFRDHPRIPDARFHKRDDHSEHAVRQNATVALGYATLLLGDYDPAVAGLPRERLEADLAALLRYLAITHRANFLPTGDGQPWGDHWQSAFWAATAGHAAWLAWDLLDEDTRLMVGRMVEHEANRFTTRPPDSGVQHDTKAEENAWNSEILALACCLFPHHPNRELWAERAIVYMLNAFVRQADRSSDRVVDGRPLRERLTAVTIHDDFTLENHHRVHPDYLSTTSLNLRNALLYLAAGQPAPAACFFNVPETFQVLKRLTATNGSFCYVNGQDWWPHRHDVIVMLSGLLSALAGDREAAFLERQALDWFGRMHARFDDGRAWDPREYNYPNAEEEQLARYAELYLLHRLVGDGPAPVSAAQFLAAQAGVHLYQTGGFVTHRTPHKLASFAWTNGAMGLVWAGDDTWLTSPSERGLVGRITCQGRPDDTPRATRHEVTRLADGFAATATVSRCQDQVEQRLALVSLPGLPVVYLERLVARAPVTVTEVATATVPLLNEDAPGLVENHRVVHLALGPETVVGASSAPDRLVTWESPWANVEGRLGVWTSRGAFAYRDANRYARSRLEEELIGNHRTALGAQQAGQAFSTSALVLWPQQTVNGTRAAAVGYLDRDGLVTVTLAGWRVTADLRTATTSVTVTPE